MPDEPDDTAPFDRPPSQGGDPDATRIGPTGPTDPDATRIHPAGPIGPDATRIGPADPDATRIGGGTSPLRPDDSGATRIGGPLGHDEPPRWSARANVPQPGDPVLRQPAPEEWVEEDPYQGRSWFTPVIVGIVALVLVGALSFGLYLIYQATADGENAPSGQLPSVEGTTSAAVQSPTPPPTSAPPTSAEPSPTTAAPPSSVTIPPLRGNTLAQATVKLQQLGLQVKVVRRADGSVEPGEVLESDPGPGEVVDAGETVTLYVATAPTAAPTKASVSPSAD
ncbi:PASTA domain-containing protein [Dactylosporangium aurantiacum]|uniref:PASTA domain-containing protein n=1 Tax=Dactylosporangium aurantiacum TaxID=35754 RepID=A0A9Q9IFY1_9ACTN|nr:PASTA domain-containing protein [Dactylosporangium aurantiacum]MDG6101208.1 PASTA domain-containing protein [Dactylosporangium aurantiacum]UWZ54771.1 PASTA domain-containing protein [Dactylosporangium aurantiacum]